MSDEPTTWQRKVQERHLDLLLAEELECNQAFALWLHLECFGPEELPGGEIDQTRVTVSHSDTIGNDALAAGETDLHVESTWAGGEVTRLLIEDKLDAILQPSQIERYEQRLEHHRKEVHAAGGLVVAPATYLEHRKDELGSLALVSVESIAATLRVMSAASDAPLSERLAWRASRLVSMKQAQPAAPDHEESIRVRDWFIARAQERDPSIAIKPNTMRTINTGWIYFSKPNALLYKLNRGCVDVYLKKIWPDQPEMQKHIAASDDLPGDFESTTDDSGNLVLRSTVHLPTSTTTLCSNGPLDDSDELARALDACVIGAAWIRQQPSSPA